MKHFEQGIYKDIEWTLNYDINEKSCNSTITCNKYDEEICNQFDIVFKNGVYYGYSSCTPNFDDEKNYIFRVIDCLINN